MKENSNSQEVMSFEEVDDIECSQKMIDTLLQSIKLEAKSLTATISFPCKTPYSLKEARTKPSDIAERQLAEETRIEVPNRTYKAGFTTSIANSAGNINRQRKFTPCINPQFGEKENENENVNASQINKTFMSGTSAYDLYDRDFARNLVNKLTKDNRVLHENEEDCIQTIKFLLKKYTALHKEHNALIRKNQELETLVNANDMLRQENEKLKSMLATTQQKELDMKESVKEKLKEFISFSDESEILLAQSQAENNKLRLMLQIGAGQEIPSEELAELKAVEKKALSHSKAKLDNNLTLGTQNMFEDLIKPDDPQEISKNNLLSQFIRDNDIVEQNQEEMNNEYEDDDEEGIVIFDDKKRRDSF